jgi:small-conductance mechanosensitive channel
MFGVDWDAVNEALTGQRISGEDLFGAGLALLLGFIGAYLIGWWRRRRLDHFAAQTRQFVGLGTRFAQVLMIAVALGWALTTLGADVGWLTVVLLVTGVIVVLALRPILEGMGASAALVTRPAFSVGDEIEVDDITGKVLEITNRSTVIRQRDGRRVHIPNVEMLSKTVVVLTVDQLRRSAVDVAVGFESDLDHVEQVLRQALGELDSIERVGSVRAQAITVGVELSVRFWHPSSIEDGNDAVNDAVRTIVATLRQEGIRFAPPAELAIVDDATAQESSGDEGDDTTEVTT